MKSYSLTHLADHALLRDLAALVAQDRTTTADLLAHLAEVDERRLYLPAGYPSMYAYCVGELRMSEDTAYKRIRVARAAREHPAIFAALADGRLNLSSVLLLTPHLGPDNVSELLGAAALKTNAEIERLLAERFPQLDIPAQIEAVAATTYGDQLAVRPVEPSSEQLAARPVEPSAPGRIEPPASRAKVTPLAPGRFGLQVTIGQETLDKLGYAQALLGHAVPSGDVAAILDRVLDMAIGRLEEQKFAACSRSRPRRQRRAPAGRYVPADVRRAVWQRDGGQCTFMSEAGHRCPARRRLEFDHVLEYARGGEATVDGMRLRCRAHNQYQAERTFGSEFMRHSRQEAQRQATEARARKAAGAAATPPAPEPQVAPEPAEDPERDVAPWLRALGFRAEQVRRGVELCAAIPDASLEERVRYAISSLGRAGLRRASPGVGSPA